MVLCPICQEKFSKDKKLVVLKCHHSFCFPCLEKLHHLSNGIISCAKCNYIEYFEDIREMSVNFDKETEMACLSMQKVEVSTSPSIKGESQWDSCPVHKGPLSLWCTECLKAICPECKEFHRAQQHQVVDHTQGKHLLLSQYSHDGQDFLEWLVKVDAAIQEMIKATQVSVMPLSQVVSFVQGHIRELKNQNKVLQETTSLETVEDLLQQRSRRCKRIRIDVQMQIHGPILALGEFASSMKSLQQLNKEMNEGFAKSGASTTSAFQQEESGVKKQNTSVPLTRTVTSSRPRVFAQSDPASLSSNQTACLDLPEDLGAHCTTHLKIVTTKVNNNSKGFWVTYVGGAGQTIFLINCDLNADQLHLRIWDLTPGQRQMKERKKSQAGLQWGIDHRFTIIHDPAQYAILLDGTVVGYVKKRNSHNQVTKIKVGSWSSTKVDVSMSSVETD